jgi:hypothetical protein
MKWLDTNSGELREQSATDETTLTAEHCAWCTVHPVTLSSSKQDVVPLFLNLAEAAPPVLAPHSHPFSWPPSQPRAPPVAA